MDLMESINQQLGKSKTKTCSKIVLKQGKVYAIPYIKSSRDPNHFSPLTAAASATLKVQDNKLSTAQHNYQRRYELHAGMKNKPLEPYSPNAFRSRLLTS